jgi:hypothetical protein
MPRPAHPKAARWDATQSERYYMNAEEQWTAGEMVNPEPYNSSNRMLLYGTRFEPYTTSNALPALALPDPKLALGEPKLILPHPELGRRDPKLAVRVLEQVGGLVDFSFQITL